MATPATYRWTPATYRWLPSNARVVAVDGFGIIPRGTTPAPIRTLTWPVKDPGDVLDYVLDLSQALAGDGGDAIATLDVQITPANPGDLMLQTASADGELAILWLAQGIAGTSYAVTMTIGTNSGRVLARTVMLPVMALAAIPAVSTPLTDQTGAPLIDQNGNSLTTS